MNFRKVFQTFLIFLILLLIDVSVFAQSENYRHYIDSDGNIVFVQKLTWKKYENIDCYRIELEEVKKDSKKARILDKRLEENSIELSLLSGTYRYRISVYNVLGNLESRSDWLEFEIFKATQPKVTSIIPESIVIKKENPNKKRSITLGGENLLRQSKYRIIDAGGMTEGTIESANGLTAAIEFDFTGFPSGNYEITVKNPGGLECTIPLNVTIEEPIEPVIPTEMEESTPTEEEDFSTPLEMTEESVVEPVETTTTEEEPTEPVIPTEMEESTPTEEDFSTSLEMTEEEPIEMTEEESVVEPVETTTTEEEPKEPYHFDLDIAVGMAVPYQITGQEYYFGKFYEEFFGSSFLFPTFTGEITFYAIKTRIGNFGIRANADYSSIKYENKRRFKSYELSGTILSALGEIVYQKELGKFNLDIHAGSGIQNFTGFKFDFATPNGNFETEEMNTSSIAIGGGVGLQFNIWKGLFVETDIDFLYNLNLGIGSIEPKAMLGWKIKK